MYTILVYVVQWLFSILSQMCKGNHTEEKGNEMTRWKPIKGYEGLYLISDEGEVFSLPKWTRVGRNLGFRKGKFLKPSLRGQKGMKYKFVVLSDGNETKAHSIHRLVATAFCDNPNNLDVVNHIDKNTLNNNADNLEWCTQQYNNEYGHNKPIIQLLDGEIIAEYKSTVHASMLTKIGRTSITNALKGWSKRAGGYEWRYKEGSDDLSH